MSSHTKQSIIAAYYHSDLDIPDYREQYLAEERERQEHERLVREQCIADEHEHYQCQQRFRYQDRDPDFAAQEDLEYEQRLRDQDLASDLEEWGRVLNDEWFYSDDDDE